MDYTIFDALRILLLVVLAFVLLAAPITVHLIVKSFDASPDQPPPAPRKE